MHYCVVLTGSRVYTLPMMNNSSLSLSHSPCLCLALTEFLYGKHQPKMNLTEKSAWSCCCSAQLKSLVFLPAFFSPLLSLWKVKLENQIKVNLIPTLCHVFVIFFLSLRKILSLLSKYHLTNTDFCFFGYGSFSVRVLKHFATHAANVTKISLPMPYIHYYIFG